jgi:hypothetical protein
LLKERAAREGGLTLSLRPINRRAAFAYFVVALIQVCLAIYDFFLIGNNTTSERLYWGAHLYFGGLIALIVPIFLALGIWGKKTIEIPGKTASLEERVAVLEAEVQRLIAERDDPGKP